MPRTAYDRDDEQVNALIASFFAQKLHGVVTDPKRVIATEELPLARIKRIMKQDSCDPHPRMVCADTIPFMAFAAQLFIAHVTSLAWKLSTQRAKRNTLQLKDLKEAVASSMKFDFLIDVVDAFENDRNADMIVEKLAPAPALPPCAQPQYHQHSLSLPRDSSSWSIDSSFTSSVSSSSGFTSSVASSSHSRGSPTSLELTCVPSASFHPHELSGSAPGLSDACTDELLDLLMQDEDFHIDLDQL